MAKDSGGSTAGVLEQVEDPFDAGRRGAAVEGLAASLEHWKKDHDFANVRDRLGDRPEPERAAWRGLWAAVDLALAAARPAAK